MAIPSRRTVDPEVAGRFPVPNPYTGAGPERSFGDTAINILWRLIILGISSFFLFKRFNVYETTFHSPHISHEWFKVGLATTIAILFLKTYMETYQGRFLKQKVNYQNYPKCTHAGIALILLASLGFHLAYWPHYGWNTPLVLGLVFWGVLLQFMLLIPTDAQNIIAFVGLTFFLQQYK
ncbi:hypothetical protein MPSEU_000863300 [Mayamaea pseudoterrestris]|nr:hypothetical protein MPSEU_000863300 [Mayamaea pseudoterrestris]